MALPYLVYSNKRGRRYLFEEFFGIPADTCDAAPTRADAGIANGGPTAYLPSVTYVALLSQLEGV
jgi:hypothetical protein